MVPTTTLVPLLNSQNIFVIKSGRVILTSVETGIRNEKLIQITVGLNVSDTIATTGLLALKDFMPVKILKTHQQNTGN